ncbi:MAG: hypothetical protein WCD79_03225 [Chthoniobacteraceae bacterium]
MQRSLITPRATSGYAKILVTKGNPSRGKGYEVSHFIVRNSEIKSLSEHDVFLPSLTEAAKWVLRNYPTATLAHGRKACDGHLAALCFQCLLSDIAL